MSRARVIDLFSGAMLPTVSQIAGIDQQLDELHDLREQLALPLEQMAKRHYQASGPHFPDPVCCRAAEFVYLGRIDGGRLGFEVDCLRCGGGPAYYVPLDQAQRFMRSQ